MNFAIHAFTWKLPRKNGGTDMCEGALITTTKKCAGQKKKENGTHKETKTHRLRVGQYHV